MGSRASAATTSPRQSLGTRRKREVIFGCTWAAPFFLAGLVLARPLNVLAEPAPETAQRMQAATLASPVSTSELLARLERGEYEAVRRALTASAPDDEAQRWLLRSRFQRETGDYQGAEAAALTAIKKQGGSQGSPAAQLALGEALRESGHIDAAQAALAAALSAAKPTSAEGYRARALLGQLLLARGKETEGRRQLQVLIDAYNRGALGTSPAASLGYVAIAARELSAFHDANRAFAESIAQRPGHVETLLEWADLFIEKDDRRQALETVEIALKYNPQSPRARTLLARLKMESPLGFSSASMELDRALAVNPNYVPAHVTRAAIALRGMDLDGARSAIERALAINAHDLEALSTRVAIAFLAGDTRAQLKHERAVLNENRRFSEMYSIVARFAEWEHRYAELVVLARKALAIDPNDAAAHATLGINLLRAGQEDEGLSALREAWERDHFNVRVFHLLNLYDEVISKQYVTFDADPFRFRMHRDERPVLEPYAPALLSRAYETMAARYGIRPKAPLRIEMYAKEEDFSLRTTGLPNVGVQGVCFGRVITAVSPRAGEYNWGQILWHELAHVFHLQLSKSRVPRWFTEGLAEYETALARPEWRRKDDRDLFRALQSGTLPALSKLSDAFTFARDGTQLMVAYHTATLAVSFLVERFGEQKVIAMLPAYGRGLTSEQVVQQVLGQPLAALDREFEAHLLRRLAPFAGEFTVDIPEAERIPELRARIVAEPRSADARAALALALVGDGQWKRGSRAARAALYFDPAHPGGLFARSRIALERGDMQGAYDALVAIVDGGHDGVTLRRMLAHAAKALGSPALALQHIKSGLRIDPSDLSAQRLRLALAVEAGDRDEMLSALRAVADLDQHDRAVYAMLLAALAGAGLQDELLRVGESALYVDPASPLVHLHLGHAYAKAQRLDKALFEYDQALRLKPERPARVHFGRALVLARLGRHEEGQAALAAALSAEPDLLKVLEQVDVDEDSTGHAE